MLDHFGASCMCNLLKLLFTVLDTSSQFMIFRPLGIKVFNLHIHVNSLLSLSDLDLGMSLDNLMHSRICIVNRGLEVPHDWQNA